MLSLPVDCAVGLSLIALSTAFALSLFNLVRSLKTARAVQGTHHDC